MAEPDLCALGDVATALNRSLDAGETDQAQQAIARVSDTIRDLTGRSFGKVKTDDVIRCQADWYGVIFLSMRPIAAVTSVKDIKGNAVDNAEWDGLREIYGLDSHQVVDITLTHGYAIVPDVIRDVAIGAAARLMVNPHGVRQETVGAISVTYPAAGGSAGSVAFSDEERDILARFGAGPESWRL